MICVVGRQNSKEVFELDVWLQFLASHFVCILVFPEAYLQMNSFH